MSLDKKRSKSMIQKNGVSDEKLFECQDRRKIHFQIQPLEIYTGIQSTEKSEKKRRNIEQTSEYQIAKSVAKNTALQYILEENYKKVDTKIKNRKGILTWLLKINNA